MTGCPGGKPTERGSAPLPLRSWIMEARVALDQVSQPLDEARRRSAINKVMIHVQCQAQILAFRNLTAHHARFAGQPPDDQAEGPGGPRNPPPCAVPQPAHRR